MKTSESDHEPYLYYWFMCSISVVRCKRIVYVIKKILRSHFKLKINSKKFN